MNNYLLKHQANNLFENNYGAPSPVVINQTSQPKLDHIFKYFIPGNSRNLHKPVASTGLEAYSVTALSLLLRASFSVYSWKSQALAKPVVY